MEKHPNDKKMWLSDTEVEHLRSLLSATAIESLEVSNRAGLASQHETVRVRRESVNSTCKNVHDLVSMAITPTGIFQNISLDHNMVETLRLSLRLAAALGLGDEFADEGLYTRYMAILDRTERFVSENQESDHGDSDDDDFSGHHPKDVDPKYLASTPRTLVRSLSNVNLLLENAKASFDLPLRYCPISYSRPFSSQANVIFESRPNGAHHPRSVTPPDLPRSLSVIPEADETSATSLGSYSMASSIAFQYPALDYEKLDRLTAASRNATQASSENSQSSPLPRGSLSVFDEDNFPNYTYSKASAPAEGSSSPSGYDSAAIFGPNYSSPLAFSASTSTNTSTSAQGGTCSSPTAGPSSGSGRTSPSPVAEEDSLFESFEEEEQLRNQVEAQTNVRVHDRAFLAYLRDRGYLSGLATR